MITLDRRALLTGAAGSVAALALTACGANERAGSSASATSRRGGTLTILMSGTDINYDPARSQSMAVTSLALVHRRLTTWRVEKGKQVVVVPDLATDTGKVSSDGLTWTYTLKEGLTMENGAPITSALIRHGIERSFADALSGGLGYHKTLLAGTKGYTGPYHGKHLSSVETPDDRTIVFHLARRYGDWPWIVSMPAFAPVPTGDDPATYSRRPVASGPYRVSSYQQGTAVTLTRNPKWSASTDSMRTALPDKIVFTLGQDQSVAAQRLIADSGDDRNAFGADLVPAAQLAQVTANPAAKNRLATSAAGPLNFLSINTERITDLDVRRAIALGIDKKAVIAALGGDRGAAEATTFITPGIAGRKEYDLFSTDTDRARKLLSGKKVGTLRLLVTNDTTTVAIGQAVAQSLSRIGLTVRLVPVESQTWEERATNGDGSAYELTLGSWNPDYPSANANLAPLFASSEIGNGGYNTARYSSPKVDQAITKAQSADSTAAQSQWPVIDEMIARDVPAVPLAYRKNSFLHGSGVSNFFVEPFPAYPNYLVVGVSS